MKNSRHTRILEIINDNVIETQDDLIEKLRESGYPVTQATVSRDINQLGLVKVAGSLKRYRYAHQDIKEQRITNKVINLFRECVISTKSVNNLIIVKTLSGCASQAGNAVDKLSMPEILGTVAGDDTLLVIVRSNEEVESVLAYFDEVFR